MVACLLTMSGRVGCLAILLDKSVKHYDLAQNHPIIDLNDGTVWADVYLICYVGVHAMHACASSLRLEILTGVHK